MDGVAFYGDSYDAELGVEDVVPMASAANSVVNEQAGYDFTTGVQTVHDISPTPKGTSMYCREKPEDKADGAEKPECTRRT